MNKVAEAQALPTPPTYAGGTIWFSQHLTSALSRIFTEIGYRLNRVTPLDGSERMTAALPLATYTVASRPSAATHPWAVIAVIDGGAGAQFQASNGTAWVNLG